MSQENVDALRDAYAAFDRGDLSRALQLCDPSVRITEPPEIPDSSTFRGRDGMHGVIVKLQEVFPDMQFADVELVADRDRVLATVRWRGTGADSGAGSEVTLFHVWTFQDSRAIQVDAFLDRKQALEAAGLSE